MFSLSSTPLPLDGLLLLLDHVCQLLEYRAQLHDGALDVLHRVCAVLDVGSLKDHDKNGFTEIKLKEQIAAQKHSVALFLIQ